MFSKLSAVLAVIFLVVGCQPNVPVKEEVAFDLESCLDAVVHIRAYGQEVANYTYYRENITPEWQGSGCFIRKDGIILTAGHVVDKAVSIKVTLRDGTELDAVHFWKADNMDVGFIKVDIKKVPILSFNTDGVSLAEEVYILGHPLGWMNNWTTSKGIISNLERDCDGFFGVHSMIQTDGASYPGNSGGPVINLHGEIVGVLVGGIQGQECLNYITPAWIAKEWSEVFESWLETR